MYLFWLGRVPCWSNTLTTVAAPFVLSLLWDSCEGSPLKKRKEKEKNLLCWASESQFGPEKMPAAFWWTAACSCPHLLSFFLLFYTGDLDLNTLMLRVLKCPPNETTDIFFWKPQLLNPSTRQKRLSSFLIATHVEMHIIILPVKLWIAPYRGGCCLLLLWTLAH